MEKEEELAECTNGCQLRLLLWLGFESDMANWTEFCPGGELATYAETVSVVL